MPAAARAELLGILALHADTRVSARYQDVASELQRDAAARMDGLVGGGLWPEP
jgi:hypothetical protein